MAGLVPAISIRVASACRENRDARHKAGHDVERVSQNWGGSVQMEFVELAVLGDDATHRAGD